MAWPWQAHTCGRRCRLSRRCCCRHGHTCPGLLSLTPFRPAQGMRALARLLKPHSTSGDKERRAAAAAPGSRQSPAREQSAASGAAQAHRTPDGRGQAPEARPVMGSQRWGACWGSEPVGDDWRVHLVTAGRRSEPRDVAGVNAACACGPAAAAVLACVSSLSYP